LEGGRLSLPKSEPITVTDFELDYVSYSDTEGNEVHGESVSVIDHEVTSLSDIF